MTGHISHKYATVLERNLTLKLVTNVDDACFGLINIGEQKSKLYNALRSI